MALETFLCLTKVSKVQQVSQSSMCNSHNCSGRLSRSRLNRRSMTKRNGRQQSSMASAHIAA